MNKSPKMVDGGTLSSRNKLLMSKLVVFYNNKKNIYWIVGILLKSNNKKITAKILGNYLKLRGIETRPFFWPINKQEIFKKLQLPFTKKKFLNSEYMSKYGLYLPAALNIKNNEIDYVCKILNNYKFK